MQGLKRLLIGISLFSLAGCVCPERPLIVNTLDQGSKTIREQHKTWASMLGSDPELRANLPVLTPQQQQNIIDLHAEFDETIEVFRNGN